MNYHEPSTNLASIVNECKKVTESEVISTIFKDIKMVHDHHQKGQLRHVLPQLPEHLTEEECLEAISSSFIDLLWSGVALFKGVQIFVEDRALVEMLLRADIDAITDDVHLPFPVCEIIVPSGILMVEDYQLGGFLCADTRRFSFCKEVEKFCTWQLPHNNPELGIYVSSRFKSIDGVSQDSIHSVDLVPGKPVASVGCATGVEGSAKLVINATTRFCSALCLYLQSKEGQLALEPRSGGMKRRGVAAALCSQLKRRKSVAVKNLITAKREPGKSHGLHHASPKAHWRKLHMRALRHERFHRNPDGSIRVILVNASLVSESIDNDDVVTTKRKLAVV